MLLSWLNINIGSETFGNCSLLQELAVELQLLLTAGETRRGSRSCLGLSFNRKGSIDFGNVINK